MAASLSDAAIFSCLAWQTDRGLATMSPVVDATDVVAVHVTEAVRSFQDVHRTHVGAILRSRHTIDVGCLKTEPDCGHEGQAAEDVLSCCGSHCKTFLSIDLVQRRESVAQRSRIGGELVLFFQNSPFTLDRPHCKIDTNGIQCQLIRCRDGPTRGKWPLIPFAESVSPGWLSSFRPPSGRLAQHARPSSGWPTP